MKGNSLKKFLAAAMSASMGISMLCPMTSCSAENSSSGVGSSFAVQLPSEDIIPTAVQGASDTAAAGKVIYSTDFEDGDVSLFSNRGGDDTTVISVSDELSVSGSKSLCASGRSESWNGPAFRLDTICQPYTEYYVSFKMRGKYYTNGMVSFQYTDSDGTDHYANLVQNISSSDWVSIENLKISFNEEQTGVFVYLEGGQDDIYIDDFTITEVPVVEIEKDLVSISDAFANDFKVGTAITVSDLGSKPFMSLLEKHFNRSITVGNEMKPDAVLQQKKCQEYFEETGDDTMPQISFSTAKPILNYCRKNNIPVRVHTLVWHSQTPDWFFKEGYENDGEWVSKEKMLQRMENYIKTYFETLTELYPDVDFYACDVVNEAWDNDGKPRQPGEQGQNGSEKSAWVQVFGDNSFIEPAFTFARRYAPKGCKLYYNDYNEYMGKCDKIIEMAEELKAKGVIDGIGMQSHLDARQSLDASFPSVGMYAQALDKYCKTGLDIQITELDATTPENVKDSDYKVQADYYKGIFDAIYAHKDSVSAVVWWGITDDKSWRAKQYPLLFDADYKAKPAYYSIMDGVEVPEVTTTTTTVPVVTTTTTTTTTTVPDKGMRGDANEDNTVDISDAVLVMQALANPDKYGVGGTDETAMTEQGKINADVYNTGDDITAKDALQIQLYLLGTVKEL